MARLASEDAEIMTSYLNENLGYSMPCKAIPYSAHGVMAHRFSTAFSGGRRYCSRLSLAWAWPVEQKLEARTGLCSLGSSADDDSQRQEVSLTARMDRRPRARESEAILANSEGD